MFGSVAIRRTVVHSALVLVLTAGLALTVQTARAGATSLPTIPTAWGQVNFPAGVPDNDCGNEFGVDAAGNIYTRGTNGYGIVRYNPVTQQSTVLDPSLYTFGEGCFEHFTVAPSGIVYVDDVYGDGIIWSISQTGVQSTVTTDVYYPGPLATDASGNLFVYDYNTENIYEIVSGVPVFYQYVPSESMNSIAVAPDGTIWAADYASGDLYHVTMTTVSLSEIGSCNAESVAVTADDAVYVADECQSSVTEILGGTAGLLSEPPGAEGYPDEVFAVGSQLYYWDENGEYTIYTLAGSPTVLAVATADQTTNGVLGQTITGTWHGVAGAVGYTCTLMLGLGVPSSFTVTAPSTSCSFVGLSPTTEYGIQVVANFVSGSSAPTTAFAAPPALPATPPPPAKHSIVCKKNHGTALKVVTAVHPTCPLGWHRVA